MVPSTDSLGGSGTGVGEFVGAEVGRFVSPNKDSSNVSTDVIDVTFKDPPEIIKEYACRQGGGGGGGCSKYHAGWLSFFFP